LKKLNHAGESFEHRVYSVLESFNIQCFKTKKNFSFSKPKKTLGNEVLSKRPRDVKALYRRAQTYLLPANSGLADLNKALTDLIVASKAAPENAEVQDRFVLQMYSVCISIVLYSIKFSQNINNMFYRMNEILLFFPNKNFNPRSPSSSLVVRRRRSARRKSRTTHF
jgi:hypothetical protein